MASAFPENKAPPSHRRTFLTRFLPVRPTSSNYSSNEKDVAQFNVPPSTTSSYRAERLDLVKPELLSIKTLNGDIMRSHQRSQSQDTLNMGERDEVTRKATLKRNTSGKLVMKPKSTQDFSGGAGKAGSTGLTDFSFGYPTKDEQSTERVFIEASGDWDEARTIARASLNSRPQDGVSKPLAGLNKAMLKAGGTGSGVSDNNTNTALNPNDPTMMSGGLRFSTRPLTALQGLTNRTDGVPYSTPASDHESGVLGRNPNPFAENLEGLRRPDERDEFGRLARERQSMMSGTVRSTTSWNTSVWGRLEREREKVAQREVMEGGLGGAGSRISSVTSVAVWRTRASWVRDQVERTRGGENREKAGMERLDG